jgi:hypothetical protein
VSRSQPRADGRPLTGFLPTAAVLGAMTWMVWYVAFHRSANVAPGRVELSRLSARRVQEVASQNGVAGGAAAGVRELMQRSRQPADRPTVFLSHATAYGMTFRGDEQLALPDPQHPPPAIRLTGIASPEPSDEAGATESALRAARDKLAAVFASLRSPLRDVPTEEELLREYVAPDGITQRTPTEVEKQAWQDAKLGPDRVWKVVTLTVSEEQLRALRARQRLGDLSRWAAVTLAVLAILYGALRADDRSQGYYTWLWFGLAAALIGGVVTLALVL